MGTMTIDGRKVEFTDERNVLTVIRNAGIDIPTLCYHSELMYSRGRQRQNLCFLFRSTARWYGHPYQHQQIKKLS